MTVLNNSIDTSQLRNDLLSVSPEEIRIFEATHGLTPGKNALFLGGVDERKGIPFLVEASRFAAELDPGFRLLIGGDGNQSPLVQKMEAEGAPVRHLGRLTGRRKAIAMRAAKVLAIPEWVGLVAVDSLAAGVPIITTEFHRHAPEFEYLRNGSNCLIVEHEPVAYGSALVELLHNAKQRERLEAGCRRDVRGLSIEEMALRFTQGIEDWHKSPRR